MQFFLTKENESVLVLRKLYEKRLFQKNFWGPRYLSQKVKEKSNIWKHCEKKNCLGITRQKMR